MIILIVSIFFLPGITYFLRILLQILPAAIPLLSHSYASQVFVAIGSPFASPLRCITFLHTETTSILLLMHLSPCRILACLRETQDDFKQIAVCRKLHAAAHVGRVA